MLAKMRYVMRDGEKVLQQFIAIRYKNRLIDGAMIHDPVEWDWRDVPLLEDE